MSWSGATLSFFPFETITIVIRVPIFPDRVVPPPLDLIVSLFNTSAGRSFLACFFDLFFSCPDVYFLDSDLDVRRPIGTPFRRVLFLWFFFNPHFLFFFNIETGSFVLSGIARCAESGWTFPLAFFFPPSASEYLVPFGAYSGEVSLVSISRNSFLFLAL